MAHSDTADGAALLERSIPDALATDDLPVPLAAEVDFLAGRVDRWAAQSDGVNAALSARSLAFLGRDVAARSALEAVDLSTAGPADLAAAAWAASRVGGPMVDVLLERLPDQSELFVVDAIPVGPASLSTGMLHAASGDIERSIADLIAAVAVGDARAPLWGALARLELGRVLLTAAAIPLDGVKPAGPTLAAAATFFAAGGYRSLSARAAALADPVQAMLRVGGPCTVAFGVRPAVDVRASKGLTALHHLISQRHRIVTAAELAVVIDGGDAAELATLVPDAEVDESDLSATIRTIFYDDATRSRISKLLRRTIAKLHESCPPLGRHLDASVHTGFGCRYAAVGPRVDWVLDSG